MHAGSLGMDGTAPHFCVNVSYIDGSIDWWINRWSIPLGVLEQFGFLPVDFFRWAVQDYKKAQIAMQARLKEVSTEFLREGMLEWLASGVQHCTRSCSQIHMPCHLSRHQVTCCWSYQPPPLQVKSNKDFQEAAQQHAEAATDRLVVLDSFNAAGLSESVRTRWFCTGRYIEIYYMSLQSIQDTTVLLDSWAFLQRSSLFCVMAAGSWRTSRVRRRKPRRQPGVSAVRWSSFEDAT